jgi:hypothetical protein
LREWNEYNNLHNALKAKLVASVNPVYLQSIRNRRTAFGTSTLREMFQHLFNTYAQLDSIQLHDAWDPAGRLEDLYSHLEDVQELATDANRPIPNADLIDAAYTTIYTCGLYDDECKTWEAKRNCHP